MSAAQFLEISITTGATLAIAAVAWWARKYPNRSKTHPERVRIPKVVPIVGWLFVSVGLLMGLWAFTSVDGPLGARIGSTAIIIGGLAFLAAYRNFYVVPGAYGIAFRSVLGNEHEHLYSDIVHYSAGVTKGQRFLTIKFVDGAKLSLNITAYDVTPMLRAIDFHHATGRWPVRTEAPQQDIDQQDLDQQRAS